MMSSCTSAAAWKTSRAAATEHDAVERGGGVGRRIEVVALGRDRLPSPVAEQRAEPLAAREKRSRGRDR